MSFRYGPLHSPIYCTTPLNPFFRGCRITSAYATRIILTSSTYQHCMRILRHKSEPHQIWPHGRTVRTGQHLPLLSATTNNLRIKWKKQFQTVLWPSICIPMLQKKKEKTVQPKNTFVSTWNFGKMTIRFSLKPSFYFSCSIGMQPDGRM